MSSEYQERYLAHQKKKAESLKGQYTKEKTYTLKEIQIVKKVFNNRSSSRVFSGQSVDIKEVLKMVETSPSSCNRKGVIYKVIENREDKETLSGILVGGVGWINRADKIVLLYTDMQAYKSPAERDFMPYLDAGVMVQSFYLACEVLGLKCCFVNPNIRESNNDFFVQRFLNYPEVLFCGAVAIGK